MKSVIIKVFIFIGLFFAADFAIGVAMDYGYGKSQNINLRDANYGFLGDAQNDIVILGASELSHALITDKIAAETGLATYNLACDACGIYYQYPLFETILEKHVPKALILSSNQMNEENLRYVAKLYPFYRKNDHVKKMIDALYPEEYLKLAFQGYVYNSNLIRIFDSQLNNLNGYVPLDVEKSTLKNIKIDTLPKGREYPVSEKTVFYFQELIRKATEADIKVYVCIPPAVEEIDEYYWAEMKSVIAGTGASLIDFSKDSTIIYDGKYFYDRAHLNHDGAEVFTENILKILKNDGIY